MKKYKKYLTGTLAAAVLASSVGGISQVMAAENSYSSTLPYNQYVNVLDTNYDEITMNFINSYGSNNITSVVGSSFGIDVNTPETTSVGSVTLKMAIKFLKEKGASLIKYIKKVPIIGKAIGNFLDKHLGSMIKFLEGVKGGVKGGISSFLQTLGLSKSTADIWADVIVTAIEFLI